MLHVRQGAVLLRVLQRLGVSGRAAKPSSLQAKGLGEPIVESMALMAGLFQPVQRGAQMATFFLPCHGCIVVLTLGFGSRCIALCYAPPLS